MCCRAEHEWDRQCFKKLEMHNGSLDILQALSEISGALIFTDEGVLIVFLLNFEVRLYLLLSLL